MNFDFNLIVFPLIIFLSVISLGSGVFLVLRSFFGFRYQITRSMNADLEIVRVSKIYKKKEEMSQQQGERSAWKEEIGAMEQLFTTFGNIKGKNGILSSFLYGTPNIVLEIANPAGTEEISFFLSFPKKFKQIIEKQIHSYFPNAHLEKITDYTIFTPGSYTAAAILTLKKSHSLPLKTYEVMESDPLNELSNAFSRLDEEEEGAAIQLVIVPTNNNWRIKGKEIAHRMQQGKQLKNASAGIVRDIGRGITDTLISANSKKEISPMERPSVQLTPEEQELVKAIEKKANKAGFKTNIRILTSAKTQARAEELLSHLESTFVQFENSNVNNFVIKRRARKEKKIAFDYIFRNFVEEDSIILGVEELAGVYHFPISTTETPRIKWLKSGAAPPPVNVPKEGLLLGFNDYRGMKTDIRITNDDRRRHIYTVGQTGTGKSTFLQELAKQDAKNGNGFCFIDPHGDAIEDILTAIPKERAEDVIVFDPADIERPFGLNMLEYDSAHPEQKTFVINEMIGIFDQLYDLKATGGPMFEQYMRNAMLLIMDDPETGSTLMEISKVLADEEFRKMKLSKCKNPITVDFWTKEAEKAGGEAALANMVPYITSKLTTFISNDMMRPIITQQKSTINFREVMDNKKILLVNLSKGKIGEINARLLGMVIVGKILMSALSRVDTPEKDRIDFYLYMDEFQNVTTNSIAQILSEARKYKLCLVLAHQFIAQLKEEISKAVFGNVGSLCAFRVGAEDAEFLEKQFAPVFTASDLVNVDNRILFAKLLINNELSKPFNMKTFAPTHGDQELANAFKELSRLKYGRDAQIVNREVMERSRIDTPVI